MYAIQNIKEEFRKQLNCVFVIKSFVSKLNKTYLGKIKSK